MDRIWTVGHSTRTEEEFIKLLKEFEVEVLVDVRTYPGSKRLPHFNKENLKLLLPRNDIVYIHQVELGGRRKPLPDSKNIQWRNDSFRGYADYMETSDFKSGIDKLISQASERKTAIMCAEAVWWRCHRSLISDHLKLNGWKVIHILNPRQSQEHPYSAPVREAQGKLFE